MDFKQFKILLERYDAGEATPTERQVVEAWYDSFSNGQDSPRIFRDEALRKETSEALWGSIERKLVKESFFRKHKDKVFRFCAAAVVVIVAGLWYVSYTAQEANQEVARISTSDAPLFISTTGSKERKQIQLPDSTQIWLNANSQLIVSHDFGDSTRVVQLIGEAFFDVKPDAMKPFHVKTGHLGVEVLGTAFNIQAYADVQKNAITVAHGLVAVTDEHQVELAHLQKGENLTYDTDSYDVVVAQETDPGSWREGKAVFVRASFDEVARVFFNFYGVRLNNLRKESSFFSYNMTILAQQPMVETLEKICSIHRLKYRRHDDEIILY